MKVEILVIGLEHVLPKVANWYAALAEQGVSSVIYSMDQYGLTNKTETHRNVRVVLVPEQLGIVSRWALGFPMLILLFLWLRPRHVEVYDPEICGRFWSACINALKAMGARIVIVNRGGAFGYGEVGETHKDWLKRLYSYAHLVVYKELYMKRLFVEEYGLADDQKLLFVHNRIPVEPEVPPLARPRPPVVLYLNNFRKWKRPDLCVKAAALVCQSIPTAEFWLVGDVPNHRPKSGIASNTVWSNFDGGELLAIAADLGVQNQVRLLAFTDNPKPYYERCSVFLFPSDLVFCNFSLLEAMERGVPSVISDDEDGGRIVDDGADGFRVPQTAEAIAEKVLALLGNEPLRQSMGLAAHAKIVKRFNIAHLATTLLEAYESRVWANG